jgi:HlyD family secretion protein
MEFREVEARFSAAKAQWQSAETRLEEAKALSATLASNRQRVRALQARLDLVEEKLAALQVRAPEDGYVAEVLVKEGAAVTAGTLLLSLDMPGLLVEAEVLAQDAPALKTGQEAIVTGEVLAGRRVLGTLTKIYPRAVEKVTELGIKERRVPVEVALSEQVAGMQPGYPVEVEIVVAEKKALAVPQEAVFTLAGRQHVFRLQGGRAVLTAVTCGLEGDDYVEVASGLQAGETVIVNPPKEVGHGTRVKPETS